MHLEKIKFSLQIDSSETKLKPKKKIKFSALNNFQADYCLLVEVDIVACLEKKNEKTHTSSICSAVVYSNSFSLIHFICKFKKNFFLLINNKNDSI